jgi:hypothetical protein
MSFADSSRVRVSLARESSYGVVNSPFDRTIQRITSSNLAVSKETTVSNELRSDAMVSDLAEVSFSSGGQLGIELSLGGSFDSLIESAVRATYTTAVDATGAMVIVAAAKTLTLASAFTNASEGQYLYIAGAATEGNNGWWRIDTKTSADEVVLYDPNGDLTNETLPATATVIGKMARNGTSNHSYCIEQYFSDANVNQVFLGQKVGELSLSVSANSIVNGNVSFQGASVTATTGSTAGTITSATTTSIINATSNVARIISDDTAFTCKVRAINLSINNNLRSQNAIGSKYPCGVGFGQMNVSGSLEVFFEDLTLYNKMLNHSDVELEFGFEDSAGNAIHFYIPRIKFASSTPGANGNNQDVVESIDWQAIANTAGTFQIQIDVANA